jgi:hypothetical protein
MNLDFLKKLDSAGRYNIILLKCGFNTSKDIIDQLKKTGVNSINIGRALSEKLKIIELSKFLAIESQEYLREIIEKQAVQLIPGKPDVVAIYNIGILLEQALSLNAANLLKELSKNVTIVLLWDHVYSEGLLHWGVQQEQYRLNLSDIYIAEGSAEYAV